MKAFLLDLRISLLATVALAVQLCGIYPLIVWGAAQAMFRDKANGSLVVRNGKVVGSRLLSQGFSERRYFHSRPSAAGAGHDASSTGGTNLGPISDKLINGVHKKGPDGKDDPANFDGVRDLVTTYRQMNGIQADVLIPADAVTRSGSGLDPHISVRNAMLQLPRVAKARGQNETVVQKLLEMNTKQPELGILGESSVNVLMLNLALDAQTPAQP